MDGCNVPLNHSIDMMSDRVFYLIDESYNCFCSYELVCRVDSIFYRIPLKEDKEPVEEMGDKSVLKIALSTILQCFRANRNEYYSDGIKSIDTIGDIYEVAVSLNLYEQGADYESDMINISTFLDRVHS